MELSPADEHRQVAAAFTDLVRSADPERWDDPAPVDGWTARDVVGHLVEWLPALLEGSAGITLPTGPPVSEDPVAAWQVHVDVVQELLDDPATADKVASNPNFGDVPVDRAIAQFYTGDVFMHTWDLAKATGQPVQLDEARCAAMLAGMEPIDEMLRRSGQYGPKVDVGSDADIQSRLMGFIGRDPRAWA